MYRNVGSKRKKPPSGVLLSSCPKILTDDEEQGWQGAT